MSDSVTQKQCTKCKKVKPIGEFYVKKQSRDGRASHCKRCASEQVNEWRKANKGRILKKVAEWIANHPLKVREYRKKQRTTHPERIYEHIRNYHARRKGALGKVTAKEWKDLCDKYGNRCIVPGCKNTDVTMDHVVPLKLGGANTIDNIQPLCRHHNSSKKATVIDYR